MHNKSLISVDRFLYFWVILGTRGSLIGGTGYQYGLIFEVGMGSHRYHLGDQVAAILAFWGSLRGDFLFHGRSKLTGRPTDTFFWLPGSRKYDDF